MADSSRGIITQVHKIARILRVGQTAIVQKELAQDKRMATLLGWDPGQWLLLHLPSCGMPTMGMNPHNALLVRFLYLGSVYGFAAMIQEVHKDRDLMFISWPKRLERVGLTQERRFELRLDLVISAAAEGKFFHPAREATLVDLSEGGCRILLPNSRAHWDEFATDVLARIEFPNPAGRKARLILARVRNTTKSGDDMELGLKFEAGQEELLVEIRASLLPKLMNQDEEALSAASALQAAEEKEEAEAPADTPAAPKKPHKVELGRSAAHVSSPASKPVERTARPAITTYRVPEGVKVEPSGKVNLSEVTTDRVIEVLGVSSISGSAVAVTRCREFVRDWVEKKGWKGATERRSVLLRHVKNIPGLVIR